MQWINGKSTYCKLKGFSNKICWIKIKIYGLSNFFLSKKTKKKNWERSRDDLCKDWYCHSDKENYRNWLIEIITFKSGIN